MTLQQFCIQYGTPLTKTNRRVRRLAHRKLAEENGLGERKIGAEDLREYGLDSEAAGLRIRKPVGHERFTYKVTEPDELLAWLRADFGLDLLTKDDIEYLADAARGYHYLVYSHEWVIRKRDNVNERFRANSKYFDRIKKILKKAGLWE